MSELQAAMVAAQQEMPKVKATGVNPHFRSTYVTLDDLLEAVLPVLNRHGLALSQWPVSENGGPPELLTILMHKSGERLQYVTPLLVAKQDMQALGSAITYARRYALTSALGIAEGDDDDGNGAVEAGVAEKPVSRPPATPVPVPQAVEDTRARAQKRMFALMNEAGFQHGDREGRLNYTSRVAGRPIASSNDLSVPEMMQVNRDLQELLQLNTHDRGSFLRGATKPLEPAEDPPRGQTDEIPY